MIRRTVCWPLEVALSIALAAFSVAPLAATPDTASAASFAVPAPLAPPTWDPRLDANAERALELQRTIEDLEAEQVALDTRLSITSTRLEAQNVLLKRAQAELHAAQESFNQRAVAMYESSGYTELAILLDATSWADLVTRATVLSRMLEVDRLALEDAAVVASQAEYQSSVLDDLRAQNAELRNIDAQRTGLLEATRGELQVLMTSLSPQASTAVEARHTEAAAFREKWRASSIPLGTRIRKVAAVVRPYTDRTYLASEFHPHLFRTTGIMYSAICTPYGPEYVGRTAASGAAYNPEDFTCASRSLAFGTWIALSRGKKRIVVVVTDRGPFVAGRDLDITPTAADALGLTGVDQVQLEVLTAGP